MITLSRPLFICLGFMLFVNYCTAVNTTKNKLYILDAKNMAKLKIALKNKKSPYLGALNKLLKQANRYLGVKNPTVISKTWLPPSGDKHDWLSHALYYWPDPSRKGGKPYKAIDGKGNPDVNSPKMDLRAGSAMFTMLPVTALAYYYTDDEKYAQKTASILRTWFLDSKTKMNPNLNFAEGIPGKKSGTIFGIITFSLRLQHIIDAIVIVQKSPHWTEKDDIAMRKWLKDYQNWLQDSKLGLKAQDQKNNHGTWFAVQMALLQLYSSENKQAIKTIEDAFKHLLPLQFNKAGLQPFETRRALSFNYSVMNLRGWICLYKLSKVAGIEKIKNIKNLINGALYLAKFAHAEQEWSFRQTKQLNRNLLLEPMQRCYNYFGKKEFLDAVKALPRKYVLTDVVQLRYPLNNTIKLPIHVERKFALQGDFKLTKEYIPVGWSQSTGRKYFPAGKVYATPQGVRLVSTNALLNLATTRNFAVTEKSSLEIELRVKGSGILQVGYFGYRKTKWSRAEYKNIKLSGKEQLLKIKLKIISRRGVPIDRIKFILQAAPNSDFTVGSYNAKSEN